MTMGRKVLISTSHAASGLRIETDSALGYRKCAVNIA
jgi:hypothetical protein